MFVGYCSIILLSLPAPHGATWCNEGVITHVSWIQGLSDQLCHPVTETVMSSCDEAALLEVEGVGDCESHPAAFAMVW